MKYYTINSIQTEKKLIRQRALVGTLFIGFCLTLLLARAAYLQLISHNKYATLSTKNQLRLQPIPPIRGLIFDRAGNLLAQNAPAYHLAIIPDQIHNIHQTLEQLSQIISFSPEQQQSFLDRMAHNPSHQRQILKLKLSEDEVSRFAVQQYRFKGVEIVGDLIRDYPYGEQLAHVIGYVSDASKEDLIGKDKKRYAGTYQIGKIGLEKFYEDSLQGTPGYHHVETDAMGREIRVLASYPATNGKDLHLTIDLSLQNLAVSLMKNKRGAIVAIAPQTGEILALVSSPSFDPNPFVRGIDTQSYRNLQETSLRPLFNRAIQGQYPPASTIKPILGLAGLTSKTINAKHKIFDPGYFQLKDSSRLYRDWKHQGHGWTNLNKALRESCDTYFYDLSEKLTIQNMAPWFEAFGFGHTSGIDLPVEQSGLVPTPAWKKRVHGTSWYRGETLITGIGQGYFLATPLQLATFASYLANRGEAFQPHLNKTLNPTPLPPITVDNPNDWQLIIDSMYQALHYPSGTAFRYFRKLPFKAAGKTGTAQVFGLKADQKYVANEIATHLRDHSLFIGFAPLKNPQIAIAVIVENERGSALISRKMMEAYLSKTKA